MIQEAVVSAIGSILEGDEAGEGTFDAAGLASVVLGAGTPGLDGATEAVASPVDEAERKALAEVDTEPGWEVSALIGQAELPRGFDQEGEAVFAVVVAELEVGAAKHVGADRLHIIELVQS